MNIASCSRSMDKHSRENKGVEEKEEEDGVALRTRTGVFVYGERLGGEKKREKAVTGRVKKKRCRDTQG